jgi:4-amino-4-deoxy-L-arabinose transferase-like glycosyltransferase
VQEPLFPVTGPDSGGYERGTGAPSRSTGTQGTVGAILIVLALGLALRLILAYLLPGSGFEADLTSFRFWAAWLGAHGPGGFYAQEFFHDYTPGYLYVLWVVGAVGNAFGGVGDLIKIPPILADVALGYVVWSMVRELGGRPRLALLGALVVMVNPIFWFDNVVWGQVDSVGVVFLLLGLRGLWRDQPERAAIYTVIAAIVKPQLGILVPLVAIVTIRRALWPIDGGTTASGDRAAGPLDRLRAWERRTGRPLRIVSTGLAGFLTAVVLCWPFGLSVLEPTGSAPFFTSGLIDQIVIAGGGYPFLTVNAYNAWAVVPSDLGLSLATSGQWVCDAAGIGLDRCTAGVAQFGPIPAVAVGAGLLVAGMVSVLWVAARRPDRLTLLVALAVLALAFFALPTRVHERYGFPFFALGAILFAVSPRWRVAYVVLSIATFANMYVVLTTLYPPTDPAISPVRDWLGIGELLRSPAGVAIVALLHTGAFLWAWLQLRGSAARRLAAEVVAAATDAAGPVAGLDPPGTRPPVALPPRSSVAGFAASTAAAAVAVPVASTAFALPSSPPLPASRPSPVSTPARAPASAPVSARMSAPPSRARPAARSMPSWSAPRSFMEAGWTGWLRDRLTERPIRADRSRSLIGEGGGRLDRVDAWFLVVLILVTLGLRTFRLAEPYQMHFDEVYHARTATEFLQDWRYGQSHDIYEWTHPHLAKYIMAGGIALWGADRVEATSDLAIPVRSVAIEHRRVDALTGQRAGERLHVATGDEIRTFDLRTRALVGVTPAPRAITLTVDATADRLVVGSTDGRVGTVDLASIGTDGIAPGGAPVELAALAHPVTHLLVTDDGATILAASDSELDAVDAVDGTIVGSVELPGIADLSDAGTGPALTTTPGAIDGPAAVASTLADLLDGDAADYEARLAAASPDATVILGSPGSGDKRKAVEAAIADGRLAGVEIVDLPRVAVATADGVSFIDPTTAGVSGSIAMEGGAHGLALVTGIDDPKLYVTTGSVDEPGYAVITVGGDAAANGPVDRGRHPLPGPGTRIAYDDASQQVHVLGRAPASRGPDAGWTVYVIEPHANAVYADAALPAGMVPAAWAMDVESQYMTDDPEQLLVLGEDGQSASIDVGSHAFAWRLPGVIAGVLMAVCLYLLARILFRRRLVAGLTAAFVVLDGMFFVQSRIGMNDVYVGLFIVAAYALFAAVWTGWWRWRGAFWVAMPVVGLLLGLALASKWVAAYAIGALALLLLVRSALGRVLAILGLIGITTVLGYLAITPAGVGIGNIPFITIMVGLTLVAVVTAVFHPIAWTDDETRLAVFAPIVAAAAVIVGALATGHLRTAVAVGPVTITPLVVALVLALGSVLAYAAFRIGGWLGYGPFADRSRPADSMTGLPSVEPPAAAPTGWLRPGWFVGVPMIWAALSLVAIPVVVYVASYLPWAAIENHQLWAGVPAGHTGQTLVQLTGQMYAYHNGLDSPHPASSPWWAWPFDLKPVWFYQEGFAAGTSAAIYDAGNLVIWWFGIIGLGFAAVMAFRRRSLALALITIGFAAQWVSWARIDRAAFQYHYYTALPFLVLALAYLVAELWHGAARRTWLVARAAAALAIVAPAALWLFARPLCGLVGVTIVNPGSAACPAVIPDFVVSVRSLALLGVMAVGAVVLARGLLALGRNADDAPSETRAMGREVIAASAVAIGIVVAALLPDSAIVTWTGIPVEPIALIVALPLLYLAGQVFAARDARRFVVGLLVAVAAWFVVWYPNIAAVPLPSTMVNAYQGLLPTYLYAFQFPVNNVARPSTSLFGPTLVLLGIAIAVTCLVVAYSASVWRSALAESPADAGAAAGSSDGSASGSDGLARTGGGGA